MWVFSRCLVLAQIPKLTKKVLFFITLFIYSFVIHTYTIFMCITDSDKPGQPQQKARRTNEWPAVHSALHSCCGHACFSCFPPGLLLLSFCTSINEGAFFPPISMNDSSSVVLVSMSTKKAAENILLRFFCIWLSLRLSLINHVIENSLCSGSSAGLAEYAQFCPFILF